MKTMKELCIFLLAVTLAACTLFGVADDCLLSKIEKQVAASEVKLAWIEEQVELYESALEEHDDVHVWK